jgi:tetratricopeptide (TPR) repeat protein
MVAKRRIITLVLVLITVSGFAQFKLYEKGHDAYTAGRYSEAITNFSEYLTKPTRDKALDVEVFYLRALSYYKSNDFNSAIDDFQETILLNHQNTGNIYWFLAKCYEKTGSLSESVNAYNNAFRELDSNKESRAKILLERSQIHSKMGNLSLAYADLKALTVLQPGNADAKRELDKLEKQNPGIASAAPAANKVTTTPATSTPTTGRATETGTKKDEPKTTGTDVAKTNSPPSGSQTQPVQQSTQPGTTGSPSGVAQAVTLAEYFKDEKRYALVIGNSNYPKTIGTLKNPVNDATDLAKELQASGFEVQLLTNATYGQIRQAMLRFKEKVDAGERDKTVSLFYYAGHGLQRDNENWLVPVDAMIEFEDDIARYCFPVQRMVLANMERSNSRMNIVILDACRNNPFPALNRSLGEQGLTEMRKARGSFIAYATAPGSVASDGTGRNGLYTQELLKAMRKPGLTIEQVFKEVRQSVLRLSGNKQNTWDSSNIIGEFYFKF